MNLDSFNNYNKSVLPTFLYAKNNKSPKFSKNLKNEIQFGSNDNSDIIKKSALENLKYGNLPYFSSPYIPILSSKQKRECPYNDFEIKTVVQNMTKTQYQRFKNDILPVATKELEPNEFFNYPTSIERNRRAVLDYCHLALLPDEEYKTAQRFLTIESLLPSQLSGSSIQRILGFDSKKRELIEQIVDLINTKYYQYECDKNIFNRQYFETSALEKLLDYNTGSLRKVIDNFDCFTIWQISEYISDGNFLKIVSSEEYIKNKNLIRKINNSESDMRNILMGIFFGEFNYHLAEPHTIGAKAELIDWLQKISKSDEYTDKEKETLGADVVAKNYEKIETIRNTNLSKEKQVALIYTMLGFYDFSKWDLRQKMSTINCLQEIQAGDELTDEQKTSLGINDTITNLKKSIEQVITPVAITMAQARNMMSGFFANNNPELYNTLSKANFEQYKKDGLPLKYSRNKFLQDLNNILQNVTDKEKEEIFKKLGITVKTDSIGKITGYDGIIDLDQLSDSGIEKDVKSAATKFIKENQVITGNSELDIALNSLIKGIPEFVNIIGKQQHDTHEYSVDIHTLVVLKEAMSNPEYQSLSNQEKFCLKLSIILHDIAKSEGIIDHGHEELSALYARDILNKGNINLSHEMKVRIYEMIKNHHWLSYYNRNLATADKTAVLFRRTGDIKIARIMAEADLKGVGQFFYEYFKYALDEDKQEPIDEALNRINSTGQVFLTNKIVDKSKVPTQYYDGKTYKVVDFTTLNPNDDLSEYGFEPGATLDDIRLFIHITGGVLLENVYRLSDPCHQGSLCATYGPAIGHETYIFNQGLGIYGVSLEAENTNIINALNEDQLSIFNNFEDFIQTATNTDIYDAYRFQIPNGIKLILNLTSEEYSQLYSQIQSYRFVSQLDNVKEIKVGDKSFSGTQIKEAILEANDSIINATYNEVNLYNPKTNAVIAKENSLADVPKELLDFAYEHELPIFLLGTD